MSDLVKSVAILMVVGGSFSVALLSGVEQNGTHIESDNKIEILIWISMLCVSIPASIAFYLSIKKRK